jgi:hypothetical protein
VSGIGVNALPRRYCLEVWVAEKLGGKKVRILRLNDFLKINLNFKKFPLDKRSIICYNINIYKIMK